MSIGEFFDAIAHRIAVRHLTVRLPVEMDNAVAPEEGYFLVRLNEMRLTDDRRWHLEITPAVFIICEFGYKDSVVRKPYFVSNELIGQLATGIDTHKLRVHFANTLVIGPTPYKGGDVNLFVGLFQAATDDRLTAMFSMFESLFSGIAGVASVASGFELANKLLPAVFKCLGTDQIKCLLAERRPISEQKMPLAFHLAYLRGSDKKTPDTAGLQVHDGELKRLVNGKLVPVDDIDFCLIQVECMETRNDCEQLPFHKKWLIASECTTNGRHTDAQAAMLDCATQITQSPDLTESHKLALIRTYTAKLFQLRSAMEQMHADMATRDGTVASAAAMSSQVRASGAFDAARRIDTIMDIGKLALRLDKDEINVALQKQMRAAAPGASARETEDLLRTLTLGSIAADGIGH